MDIFDLITPVWIWFVLIAIVNAYKSMKQISEFYYPQKKVIAEIGNVKLRKPHLRKLHDVLGDYVFENKAIKLSFLQRLMIIFNDIKVKRVVYEELVIVEAFILNEGLNSETNYEQASLEWDQNQTAITFKHLNSIIDGYAKSVNTQFTQIEMMYFYHLVLCDTLKRFKLNENESFVFLRLNKMIFKDIDKVKFKDVNIESLANAFIDTAPFNKARLKYTSSMSLKVVFFLHPAFNNNVNIKKFKAQIS